MKLNVYAVHDSKAEAYMNPFFLQNDNMAIRGFSDAVNGDTPINKHPSDYTLFHIGNYSEVSGSIEPVEPKSLGNGVAYLAK